MPGMKNYSVAKPLYSKKNESLATQNKILISDGQRTFADAKVRRVPFILTSKTWSSGPGQRNLAMP